MFQHFIIQIDISHFQIDISEFELSSVKLELKDNKLELRNVKINEKYKGPDGHVINEIFQH